jgi:hypothetical protein
LLLAFKRREGHCPVLRDFTSREASLYAIGTVGLELAFRRSRSIRRSPFGPRFILYTHTFFIVPPLNIMRVIGYFTPRLIQGILV